MPTKITCQPLLALALFFFLTLPSFALGAENAGAKEVASIRYTASIPPLAAILRELCRGRAEVEVLLPPGASPHTYQPTPAVVKALSKATALFYVGVNLDKEWIGKLPATNKVELLPLLPSAVQLPAISHHDLDGHDHGEGEEQGGIDPHFWTDPLTVKELLPKLTAALVALDPAGRAGYQENSEQFGLRLVDLDRTLRTMLGPIQAEPLLMFHPAFQYLIHRYQLTLGGLIEPFPGREPSPKYLHEVLRQVKALKVKAIFSEPQLPKRPAQMVAETAKISVYELDPEGGRPGRQSYEELLLFNAKVLLEALR